MTRLHRVLEIMSAVALTIGLVLVTTYASTQDNLSYASRVDREIAAKAPTETPEELLENLLGQYCLSAAVAPHSFTGGGAEYIDHLRGAPRVKRILEMAEDGSDHEQDAIVQKVKELCQVYIEELPDFAGEGKPWHPSVMFPGGGIAYAFILGELPDDKETINLLVQMHERLQEAARAYFKVDDNRSEWIGSEHGLILAYACDHILYRYATDDNLKQNVTSGQKNVLEEYLLYVKKRERMEWDWNFDQLDILRYANEFAANN